MNEGNAVLKERAFSPNPVSPSSSPLGYCWAEVRGARSERCLTGHGQRRSGGAPTGGRRRCKRRRLGAGGGPAAGRSAVGLHRAGRPGAR